MSKDKFKGVFSMKPNTPGNNHTERLNQVIGTIQVDMDIAKLRSRQGEFPERQTYLDRVKASLAQVEARTTLNIVFAEALIASINNIEPWTYPNYLIFLDTTYYALLKEHFPNDIDNSE